MYFKRKQKWLICGHKITCLIPNLQFHIAVLEIQQADYEKVDAWLNTVILEILYTKKAVWTPDWYTQAHSSSLSWEYLQKAPKLSSTQWLISPLLKLLHFLLKNFL